MPDLTSEAMLAVPSPMRRSRDAPRDRSLHAAVAEAPVRAVEAAAAAAALAPTSGGEALEEVRADAIG